MAQELREAVLRFRAAGKKAYAFADTFGEFGPGNLAYYLATGFDEIHLQPSGDLGLIGLQSDQYFLRGVFDNLQISAEGRPSQGVQDAKNRFMERSFTDAHREASTKLLNSLFDQMVAGIAKRRKLDEAEVRTLIDKGPYLGAEAVEAGLVDKLSYWDELRSRITSELGKNPSSSILANTQN